MHSAGAGRGDRAASVSPGAIQPIGGGVLATAILRHRPSVGGRHTRASRHSASRDTQVRSTPSRPDAQRAKSPHPHSNQSPTDATRRSPTRLGGIADARTWDLHHKTYTNASAAAPDTSSAHAIKRKECSPHTQRPRRHTESEPGEPAGPPRTLQIITRRVHPQRDAHR